ncbi:hypothetical protein GCM10012275_54740 [Longimycelium tulufanense]|uniref:Pre-toxin TG domain-containing protein n=1 Tax=Longimycelium tulufanense TaxID=907463 RepID=A0A8J3FWH3_9PSEU|nr:pre-toxin TG domain-containing protein [Longimycelium tulufanense]GGM77150.1 hypothetical protein GCM10012275_54740 [Longimycelium tulufanense]
MGTIAPYKAILAQQEAKFRKLLLGGKESAFGLALQRTVIDILRSELAHPKSVLVWDSMGPDPKFGVTGPPRWVLSAQEKAHNRISPHYMTPEQLARKWDEYRDLRLEMLKWGQVKPRVIKDKQRGIQYLILGADPLVGKIMRILSDELDVWVRAQPNTRTLATDSPMVGLAKMLHERPDLSMLLRIAQTLPLDVEVSSIPVDRPAFVEAIELAVGLIPVVGNVVAAYEAWAGEDLFGYKLSDVERGVLAASVLLPTAGRLVKGGRALYTEARLVSMYGKDAAAWARATGASGRGLARRDALGVVGRAEQTIRGGSSLTGTLLKESADAVPKLAKGGAPKLTTTVDQVTADLWRELSSAHTVLRSLDEPALERILAKGPNVDHLKGQLLEELVESRLVPWLSTRHGGFALGIAIPAGKKLEFIPGHLIRDVNGRQLTDGILAYRDSGNLVIAAVFEAKAGKRAARELSHSKGGISSLTKDELAELRANAKDVWRDLRDEAKAAGKPFTKKLDDVMKEYALSERGGQVRRDIERLAEATAGTSKIRVGSQEIPVRFSPTKTKFFGVVPRDLSAKTIKTLEGQLAAEKVTYEILGLDITASTLKQIAAKLKEPAAKLATAAP